MRKDRRVRAVLTRWTRTRGEVTDFRDLFFAGATLLGFLPMFTWEPGFQGAVCSTRRRYRYPNGRGFGATGFQTRERPAEVGSSEKRGPSPLFFSGPAGTGQDGSDTSKNGRGQGAAIRVCCSRKKRRCFPGLLCRPTRGHFPPRMGGGLGTPRGIWFRPAPTFPGGDVGGEGGGLERKKKKKKTRARAKVLSGWLESIWPGNRAARTKGAFCKGEGHFFCGFYTPAEGPSGLSVRLV